MTALRPRRGRRKSTWRQVRASRGPVVKKTRARAGGRLHKTRRRVTQESVDQMADLRRQGFTFREIGNRVGCSERTARRYAGRVTPKIEVPGPATIEDADVLRQRLGDRFGEAVHLCWSKCPSVLFVDEAIRQFRAELAVMDVKTLRLLDRDQRMLNQIFRQVVEPLARSYLSFQDAADFLQQVDPETPRFWRPGQLSEEPDGTGGVVGPV
jgi:hypothetical protein